MSLFDNMHFLDILNETFFYNQIQKHPSYILKVNFNSGIKPEMKEYIRISTQKSIQKKIDDIRREREKQKSCLL